MTHLTYDKFNIYLQLQSYTSSDKSFTSFREKLLICLMSETKQMPWRQAKV